MKKILIIEDDFAIRQSVEYALRRQNYEVKSLDNGRDALDTIKKFAPDLIVLDIMLPGVDGLEIAHEVRSFDTTTAIIIVSALGESSDKVKGLTRGADDYVAKPFALDELLARIEANLRRVSKEASTPKQAVYSFGDVVLDESHRTVSVAGHEVELRSKEFDLLAEIVRADGKVCTRQELAQNVWGYEYLDSSRTLDVHIRNLRRAVEDPSRFTFIKTVHGVGYQLHVVEKEGANT